MKTKTIPVTVGALGMIKRGHRNMLMKFKEIHAWLKFKKIVLNSTAHILRRTLSP